MSEDIQNRLRDVEKELISAKYFLRGVATAIAIVAPILAGLFYWQWHNTKDASRLAAEANDTATDALASATSAKESIEKAKNDSIIAIQEEIEIGTSALRSQESSIYDNIEEFYTNKVTQFESSYEKIKEEFQRYAESSSVIQELLMNSMEFGVANCSGEKFVRTANNNTDMQIRHPVQFSRAFEAVPLIFLSLVHMEAGDYNEYGFLAVNVTENSFALDIWLADATDLSSIGNPVCEIQWIAIDPSIISQNKEIHVPAID